MKLKHTLMTSAALVTVVIVWLPPLFAGADGHAPPKVSPTTTLAAIPTGEFVVPPGYSPLVDDTGRITMSVPDTWTDIDTAPFVDNGVEVPRIEAATDLDVWTDTFDAPGALFAAFPFTPDPQTLIDRFGLTSGCAASTTVAYDDGAFAGTWGQWTECGPTRAAEWHLIVASPGSQAFTALVIVQLTGPQDQQAFDVVRETFNTTPGATFPPPPVTAATAATAAPGTTVAVPPPVSTAPVPPPPPITSGPATTIPTTAPITAAPITAAPITIAAPVAGITLIDRTGLLTVVVPADWIDQNTSSSRHDDGRPRPTISAAPDLDRYLSAWTTPGLYLVALPPTADPAAVLGEFSFANSCTDGGTAPFDDGRFVGQLHTWQNCGGTATRVLHVAVRPADNSFTLLLQLQVTTADDTIVNQILGSFGTVPGATFQQPGPPPQPVSPTGQVPPDLLSAALPQGAVMLNADAGGLSIAVPATFVDIDTSTLMNDDGSDRPRIAAAPVLDDFFTDWGAAGMTVVAYPFNSNPAVLLQNLGFAQQCDDGGLQSFSTATFTGLMQTWQNCGNTATRNVQLALNSADQTATVFVEVQLPDADNTALAAVLSSLRLT